MMKPYPEYKDSGIEWIGKIPKNWEISSIKKISNRIDVGIAEAATHAYRDKGIPIIRSKNIKEGKINFDELIYIDENFADKNNSRYLYSGDLITVRTGNAGISAVVPSNLNKTQCFTMLITTLKNSYAPYFYSYFLNSVGMVYFNMTAWGTAQKNISVPILSDCPILVPFFNEQINIVNFLDYKTKKIDELVAGKEKLIELLKEQRAAVINHAVTKGLDPHAKMKDSGIPWLGDIPEHWEISKLKFATKINKDTLPEHTDDEYTINYIDIGNVNEDGIINPPQKMIFKDAPSRARRIVNKGDVIVSTVRTYLKAITHIDIDDENLIASTGFAVITISNRIVSKYLYYLMSSQKIVDTISSLSVGVSYPAVNSSELASINIWFPDTMSEQNEIIKFIENKNDRISSLINRTLLQIELLKEYRKTLISDAVTGKIDVRGFEP